MTVTAASLPYCSLGVASIDRDRCFPPQKPWMMSCIVVVSFAAFRRPNWDTVQAVVDRTRMFYSKEVRPYLSGVLDAFKNDPGPPPSDQDAPPPPPSVAR